MPELSNLIRQRLGGAKAPGTHPDADLMGAYAEGGLQPAERAEITRHLALCSDCRELLALSLPEQEAVLSEARAFGIRNRFFGAYLRIAGSLAVIAVAVLLFLKNTHQQAPRTQSAVNNNVAQSIPPSAPTVAKEAAAPPTAPAAKTPAPTEERVANAPARPATVIRRTEPAQAAKLFPSELRPSVQKVEVASSRLPQDYINSQVLANQLFLADQAQRSVQDLPTAPAPAFARDQKKMFLAGGVAGASDFSGIPIGSIQQRTQGTSTVSIFRDPSHHGFSITSTIARVGTELHLKRPLEQITSQNANAYAMFKPAPGGSANAELASAGSSTENLKQSSAFTALAMAAPSRAQSQMFLWRIVQGKLLKSADMSNWMEGYPVSEGIDFTVVRSAGPDVWAGGSNAALVHSTDSGASWQRIVLGAAAMGAIISIEASDDDKNIQVTSSSGQSWASRDGGKTWMMVN